MNNFNQDTQANIQCIDLGALWKKFLPIRRTRL